MPVKITLHSCPGRSNLEWTISEEKTVELAGLLNQISKPALRTRTELLDRLSYRGITIATPSGKNFAPYIHIRGGVVRATNLGYSLDADSPNLENWLLDTAGDVVPYGTKLEIRNELARLWFAYCQYR